MDVSFFDFVLPDGRIALRPAVPRDSARMLVVAADGRLEHKHVSNLPQYLAHRDVLVTNDSKVIPARLHGRRLARTASAAAEPKLEILLCRRLGPGVFTALARPARKLSVGDTLKLGLTIDAQVAARGEAGEVVLRFALDGAALDGAIAAEGETPLPPYIAGKRKADARDISDYQTVYARVEGSVAAPTAGLHFTPALFEALAARGVGRESVTLHVGPGTFLPVSAADTAGHKMHSEWATLTQGTAARLNAARSAGGRIVAVGTTSLRTLESAADAGRAYRGLRGRNGYFHHARLPLPHGRGAADQFPFAALDAVHAGQRLLRHRDDAGGLCRSDPGALSLLFLWRRLPAIPAAGMSDIPLRAFGK